MPYHIFALMSLRKMKFRRATLDSLVLMLIYICIAVIIYMLRM